MIGSCLFFVFIELIYLLSHWFSYGENRLVKMDSVIFFLVFQANLMHFWPLFHIMATEEHWPEMGEWPLELQLLYFSFRHICVNYEDHNCPLQELYKKDQRIFSEAAIVRVLQKSCSWIISQYSQKTPVLESLFDKVADLKACNFIKKVLRHRCFRVNIAKFLRTPTG